MGQICGLAAADVKAPRGWTPEEERQLLELRAFGLPLSVVARMIGRTEAAVVGRLGLLKARQAAKKE